jgi:DNA-binding transcriptional ArsR family regulator
VETPGFRRYFVSGSMGPREMRRAAFLRDGPCEKVFVAIEARPDITLGDVAREAGLSLPYASRTVTRLVAAGLVERRREGGSVRLRTATDSVRPE